MKVNFLKKVIADLQQATICPNCKGLLSEDGIEVTSIINQKINFIAHCEGCSADIHLVAEVKIQPKRERMSRLGIPKIDIQALKASLKNMTAKDIQDIL